MKPKTPALLALIAVFVGLGLWWLNRSAVVPEEKTAISLAFLNCRYSLCPIDQFHAGFTVDSYQLFRTDVSYADPNIHVAISQRSL